MHPRAKLIKKSYGLIIYLITQRLDNAIGIVKSLCDEYHVYDYSYTATRRGTVNIPGPGGVGV